MGSVRLVGGRYELGTRLGQGAMGAVYRAFDRELGRHVALKLLLAVPAGSADGLRLRREAQIAAGLRHPGIVVVHDVGEVGGELFQTMDLVEGPRWDEHVEPLALEQRVALLAAVAEAVGHAHAQGVIHRDIKPGNTLIDETGSPRLVDFGLARQLDSYAETERLTLSGEMLGTVGYMSPEQIAGRNNEVGPPSDVWALGTMLYQLLTDRLPFARDTLTDVLMATLRDEPARPRGLNSAVPAELEAICLKCLEKQPRARYPDASALAGDLRAHLEGRQVAARPVGRLRRGVRSLWRRRGLRFGLGAVLCTVMALGLLWMGVRQHRYRSAMEKARGALRKGAPASVARDHAREAITYRDTPAARELLASAESRLRELEGARNEKVEALRQGQVVAEILLGPFAEGVKAVAQAAALRYGGASRERFEGPRRRLDRAAKATRPTHPGSPVVASFRAYFEWLSGNSTRGLRDLARLAEAHPELPFAHQFLALSWLGEYLRVVRHAGVRLVRGRYELFRQPQSADARRLAARILRRLEAANEATVFPDRVTRVAFGRFLSGLEKLVSGAPGDAAGQLAGASWSPLLRFYAREMLAKAYYDLDRLDEAIQVYSDLFRETGRVWLRYHIAISMWFQVRPAWSREKRAAHLTACISHFDAVLKVEPDSLGALKYKAFCQLSLSSLLPVDKALREVREARELLAGVSKNDLLLKRARARLELVYGQLLGESGLNPIPAFESADKLYAQVWEAGARNPDVSANWARVLYNLSLAATDKDHPALFARTVRLLDETTRNDPTWADPYLIRGALYLGRAGVLARASRPREAAAWVKKAQESLRQALALDRANAKTYREFARSHRLLSSLDPGASRKHMQASLQALEKAVAIERSPQNLLLLAKTLMSIGFDDATSASSARLFARSEACFTEVLKLDPRNPEALFTRALFHVGRTNTDRRVTVQQVLKWMPPACRDLLWLVRGHEALVYRALPLLVQATAHLGWACEKLGRDLEEPYRREIQALELAIKHDLEPTEHSVRLADRRGALARYLQGKGRPAEAALQAAAAAYQQAAGRAEKDGQWRRHVGRCWSMAGNMHTLYADAIKARVGDVSGVHRQALRCYDRAIAKQPGFHFAYYYRARCALVLGKLRIAMKDVERLESARSLPVSMQREVARLREQLRKALRGK